MKKTIGFLLVVGLMVGAMAAVALASTPGDGIPAADDQTGANFVDVDGDGVCDEFVDEDGDGVCDNAGQNAMGEGNGYMGGRNAEFDENGPRGTHQGSNGGAGFVDADGDGVCDNCVDEDGDGVCDNAGAGEQQQKGHGHGRTR